MDTRRLREGLAAIALLACLTVLAGCGEDSDDPGSGGSDTAAVLNELLKGVVAHGTGSAAALEEHVVAGKTGTAQKAMRGGYSPDRQQRSGSPAAPGVR